MRINETACHYFLSHRSDYTNIDMVINEISTEKNHVSHLYIEIEKIYQSDPSQFNCNLNATLAYIFEKLSKINRYTAFPSHILISLAEYFEKALTYISEKKRKDFFTFFIELFCKYPFSQADFILIKVLDKIIDEYPILSNIIYTKFSAGIILPIQAVQYVKNEFEIACHARKIPIQYDALDSFEEFHISLKSFKNESNEKRRSFIVRHPDSCHVTQIHIEKEQNKFNFFISDSLGYFTDEKGYTPRFTIVIIKELHHIMKDAIFELYVVKEQRQHDHVSCTTIALKDVKQIFKKNSFFYFIENEMPLKNELINIGSEILPEYVPINWILSLPMEFKRITQSLSAICEYEKHIHTINENKYQVSKLNKIMNFYKWYLIDPETNDYRCSKIARNGYALQKRNKLIQRIVFKAMQLDMKS